MREQVGGFKLDKSHTFAVNMFDEIERYMRVPDEYEPPEEKTFQPSVGGLSALLPLGGEFPRTRTMLDAGRQHWRSPAAKERTTVWHACFLCQQSR